MDHLSDTFLLPHGPLEALEEAAMAGKEMQLREMAHSFKSHTEQLEKARSCSQLYTCTSFFMLCV